ncbi:AraC family transcriptional regulator [Chryseosolibacter indicus]|uniref:AraC family transcriptional regulator n=1 Tax=Chryseosolibacter indicus TaxID=2782351 RepID=A0ABS5VTL1_9BACT|nr:AraC family transcriptional regulator [Chryseosolibacter indicus]MBT1703321.1 AraC family transcriptional regulator [Chryseosolibacter indicus]
MKRYVLHEPFNIYHFEAEQWQHPLHNHTYFEVIFIIKGKGIHNINGNKFKYTAGDVFLLGPEDYHEFKIASLTEFCYIRFNESFSKYNALDRDKNWQHVVKLLLHTSYQSKGSMVQSESEKLKLRSLLAVLQAEYENRTDAYFEVIRDSLMRTMMTIMARNISRQSTLRAKTNTSSIEDILLYIRQNIYKPENLKVHQLAEQFNYAPTYLSIYFKRHTGESLKQYISKYKLKLIESRLLYSQASLSQIADEFGYTDESHFCKQFRKHLGITPTNFRRR